MHILYWASYTSKLAAMLGITLSITYNEKSLSSHSHSHCLSLSLVCDTFTLKALSLLGVATCIYFQTYCIQRVTDMQQVATMFTVQSARINENWHAAGRKSGADIICKVYKFFIFHHQ